MAHGCNEAAMTRSYVPVIRGDAGELDALAWLPDSVRECVMPLVEIVPGRLDRTVRSLAAWGDAQPVLIDTVLLDNDATETWNRELVGVFERCRGVLRA